MQSKTNLHLVGKQSPTPQVAESRHFGGSEPIRPIAERICYRFAEGALERYLSAKYEITRPMIEAVIRREFRRLRAENAELRRELRRAA